VTLVRYELRFYIPEEDIHHSPRRETFKIYGMNSLFSEFLFIYWARVEQTP
jgi:hypothetical protein